MGEHRVELEQHVAADAERVWEVLTDIRHADQTLSGIERVEVLTDGPYGVGTTWRETRKMFGQEATEEMTVTVVEAPTRAVVEADSAGTHYVTEFTLTPVAAGSTRLAMSFTAAPSADVAQGNPVTRLLGRVMAPIGVRAVAKVMAKDLREIAAAAEAR